MMVRNSDLVIELFKKMVDGAVYPDWGICGNLHQFMDERGLECEYWECYRDIREVWENWPNYSGEFQYPISGHDSFEIESLHGSLWRGESRELRMDLMKWLIDYLEASIAI